MEEFIDDEKDPPILSMHHQAVLTILYHESVISLNRPILAASGKGSAYDAALQQCIGASRSIITTLHKAIQPPQRTLLSQALSVLLWPSVTWAVWMSTFILFHAVSKGHVSSTMASRSVSETSRLQSSTDMLNVGLRKEA